jgi:ABC-type lipoprotein export system ATPase subunit
MRKPLAVSLVGLRREYRGPKNVAICAVDSVDMEVRAGEFLAICGKSGSGKSTVLGLMGGLLAPTAGSVVVNGKTIAGASVPQPLSRCQGIGYLFQFDSLLPGLRVIDNVALPLLIAGATRVSAYSQARDWLARVGMAERWDARPAELSGGQQRRIGLARALITQPGLLLADEPTADLDPEAALAISDILQSLKESGDVTIVIVTHDMSLAAGADRVVHMSGGRLVAGSSVPSSIPHRARAEPSKYAFEPAPAGMSADGAVEAPLWLFQAVAWYLSWMALAACCLLTLDMFLGKQEKTIIADGRIRRQVAEEMAMQDLRSDILDVTARGADEFELTLFMQNYRPERSIYVLAPVPRLFYQMGRSWKALPVVPVDQSQSAIVEVTGEKGRRVFRFSFPAGEYDQLLSCYAHLRINNGMVVGEHSDGTGELFEREDSYYLYLKDPGKSDSAVRLANGWKSGATVPPWMAMPSH